MKERIWSETPDSAFEAVVLPGNEKNISWEEEGKEFSFRGMMYDVVRTKTVNGKTILLCVNDNLENQLLQQINDITATNQQHDSRQHPVPGFKLLYDIFFPEPVGCLSFTPRRAPVRICYTVALADQPHTIQVPPPRGLL